MLTLLHPDFEFRDLRRQRDVWRLRLWQVKAVAISVVVVLMLTCSAVYIVRHSLIEGHPPPGLSAVWP
jgi:hypothetical protein